MTPEAKYNRKNVATLAYQGMSQSDIAEKLNIAMSTVYRIKVEMGINLPRKERKYGPRHARYTEAREGLQDNSERAEDGSGSQLTAEDTGTAFVDRFAEVRNGRSPEARLKIKLEGVTDPYIRREIELGHMMVEHENLARINGAKGRISNREIKRHPISSSARTIVERRKAYSDAQSTLLLRMLDPDDVVTAAQAAPMIGQNVQRASNYLNNLFEKGELYRERRLVKTLERTKRQWRWVFSKKPIEPIDHSW